MWYAFTFLLLEAIKKKPLIETFKEDSCSLWAYCHDRLQLKHLPDVIIWIYMDNVGHLLNLWVLVNEWMPQSKQGQF